MIASPIMDSLGESKDEYFNDSGEEYLSPEAGSKTDIASLNQRPTYAKKSLGDSLETGLSRMADALVTMDFEY